MSTLQPRSSDDPNKHEPSDMTWSERNGCAGQTAWLALIAIVLLAVVI